MKKLNRKGFTLIELLAVIVILAIVMVVTIPSVLNSMDTARQKQFENAIHSIEEYVQKNYDLCKVGGEIAAGYDENIFSSGTCNVLGTPTNSGTIIEAAGYKTEDIVRIAGEVNTQGKYIITYAQPGSDGQFKGATEYRTT